MILQAKRAAIRHLRPPLDPHLILKNEADRAISRFPRLFDERLLKGLDRIIVNSSDDFLFNRPLSHLRKILLAQYFLQKKMEADDSQKSIFLKLFRSSSRICASLAFSSSFAFQRPQLLRAVNNLLPGVHEIQHSFYLWHHPELPYFFWYLELQKMRGPELSRFELTDIETILREQLLAIPSLTPALFWPYNKEESFRQVQILKQEMHSKKDLPHVSISFQEQHPATLEFFIHLVRPKSDSELDLALKRLPDSLHYLRYFHCESKNPFPIEIEGFSISVPSHVFDIQDSINLLYARRYILKFLEAAIGPFRDYNGGLFAKQQEHFEAIRVHLGSKIPHFDLFAERLFYALHPVETWLSLSLNEAEELFVAFSELIQEKKSFAIRSRSGSFTIIKTADGSSRQGFSLNQLELKSASYAQIIIGGFHYLCLLGPATELIQKLDQDLLADSKRKTLRLVFQEGVPPSLNPHYSSGDMRCRLLNKLLFEGLVRLNEQGKPELGGAMQFTVSNDGLVYTFKLRPSCWSNGESVTAIDYAASMQSAIRDHLSHPELLFGIKNAKAFKEKRCGVKELGILAIDTETLQIELERPDPDFIDKLAKPYFFPLFGVLREPKWFNGPYLVREQFQDGLLLERNPYFWDVKRCFFEQIDIRWLEDERAIDELFKNGKIDWIGDPLTILSPEQMQRLREERLLQKKTVNRRFFIYFNTAYPLLASAKIRRSLSLSIDRSFICSEIFPDCEPLHPLLPDAAEANRLFQQGLEELNLTKDSLPPLIFSYSHQTRREKLALYLQSAWKETLGLPVQIEVQEWNDFRSRLEKREFHICGTIQDTENEHSIEFFERFENSSSWNFSQWTHVRYRELIEKAKKEPNSRWRRSAETILAKEAPFAALFNYVHFYAHHPELDAFHCDTEGCIDFSWAHFKHSRLTKC
jgi:oligopeptide transport system substrate-binding protein